MSEEQDESSNKKQSATTQKQSSTKSESTTNPEMDDSETQTTGTSTENTSNKTDKSSTVSKQKTKYSNLDKEWTSLNSGEEILYWTHPSLFKFVPDFLFSISIILVGFYLIYITNFGGLGLSGELQYYSKILSLLFTVAGFGILGVNVFKYHRQFYVLTSERVIKKTAILNTNPDFIDYDSIQMTRIRQRYYGLEEFLGYGHITIASAATAHEEMWLAYVTAPSEFKIAIEEANKFGELRSAFQSHKTPPEEIDVERK